MYGNTCTCASITSNRGEKGECLGVDRRLDKLRNELRENNLTLDGHDLFETVQRHLTLLCRREVVEERSQDLV